MSLGRDLERQLGQVRIGMLALNDGRHPLVNPAAFHYAAGSLWMTTSRYAVKLTMARRDPRVAFVVASGEHTLLFQGLLDAYDLRSPGGSVRAALDGPRFAWSVAGYALKNAPLVGGYLLDLVSIPGDWWPHNRVVLRLRTDRARSLIDGDPPPARLAALPGPPGQVARSLGPIRQGYLCWSLGGPPLMAPAWWALDEGGAVAWLPQGAPRLPRHAAPGALVVERHHAFRATRMLGACLRGRLAPDPGPAASAAIQERYGVEPPERGTMLRLHIVRTTWWRGFDVATATVAAETAAAPPERRAGRQSA